MNDEPGSVTPDTDVPNEQRSLLSTVNQMTQSVSLRAGLTAALAMVMLIPLGMVSSVVSERGYRYQGVLNEIASTWGNEQTIAGPVLTVPFTQQLIVTETIKDEDGKPSDHKKTIEKLRHAYFLPTDLQLNTVLAEEFRTRSIFKSIVFQADVHLDARFDLPAFETLAENIIAIHWNKAFISVGVSDTRAINKVEAFTWNGQHGTLSSGTHLKSLSSGFHSKLPNSITGKTPKTDKITPDKPGSHQLSLQLNLKGSGGFYFTSHGERTRVSVESSWPHPSFQGATLPTERTVTEAGFDATWDISHLARNFPQYWLDKHPELFELTAGVRMFEPNSLYSRITRAIKYGVLFIGLTFLTLFIFELSIGKRIQFIQYGLIGISLSLFYLVLLSLSEHIEFYKAYAAATLTCTTMISVYTGNVLKSTLRGIFVAVMLFGLYALLYSLIKMEDFALLMGTFVLLLVVVILMVLTRNQSSLQAAR